MENNFLNKIEEKIKNGEENSPFLFVAKNLEILNENIKSIAWELCGKFDVPKVNIFVLEDNWEKIKIQEIKNFLQIKNTNTPYSFQIFFIENISRMTISAANSCLKFFEEPWKKNLIFLSNTWEIGVMETILSRVQIVDFGWVWVENKNDFYYDLLEKYFSWDLSIISYFFRNKLEKEEYIKFLKTLIIFLSEKMIFIDYLDEINEDIFLVSWNNVNARSVVDKWILRLK